MEIACLDKISYFARSVTVFLKLYLSILIVRYNLLDVRIRYFKLSLDIANNNISKLTN